MAEIRYAISCRGYESRPPSLTLDVYAADGESTILTNDPHSRFSHLFYSTPEFDVSEYDLEHDEASLRRRMERDAGHLRLCAFEPGYPVTREQAIDLFLRGPEYPISAETIEAVLHIPAATTTWFNHDGYVPAGHVLRELRQRLIEGSPEMAPYR